MEELLATITAMRHQEESYKTKDYLCQRETNHTPTLSLDDEIEINAECREKMASWCYQVVDFCKFHHESVEIAMSFLDRYLLTKEGGNTLNDASSFQLASMTALYTAVKIHEAEAMDPRLVSTLSRGAYTEEDITSMERSILECLKWRVNPPTSLAFVRYFLGLIPSEMMDDAAKSVAYDVTMLQTEIAVKDYSFISINPSTIAFCSLMNSLECMKIDIRLLGYIGTTLAAAIELNCESEEVTCIQEWLYDRVVRAQPELQVRTRCALPHQPKRSSRRMSIEVSPRGIV